MDAIHLDGLEIETIIGIFDWEREVPQRVRLDLTLWTDVRPAAASDRIEDAVDYKSLTKGLLAFVGESRFGLIERLAEEIAARCLAVPGVARVRVRVGKPGAVRHAETVAVEITRPWEDAPGGG